jgi:hypothetical protein
VPVGEIRRTLLFPESATYTAPEPATATPRGCANWAEVVGPSTAPMSPLPASVVTWPLGATVRMRWFAESATIAKSLPFTAMADGEENEAAAPKPFAAPGAPLPASVEVAPPGATARMRLFEVSAMSATPEDSTATPSGAEKRELAPTSESTKEGAPEAPARVEVAATYSAAAVVALNVQSEGEEREPHGEEGAGVAGQVIGAVEPGGQ